MRRGHRSGHDGQVRRVACLLPLHALARGAQLHRPKTGCRRRYPGLRFRGGINPQSPFVHVRSTVLQALRRAAASRRPARARNRRSPGCSAARTACGRMASRGSPIRRFLPRLAGPATARSVATASHGWRSPTRSTCDRPRSSRRRPHATCSSPAFLVHHRSRDHRRGRAGFSGGGLRPLAPESGAAARLDHTRAALQPSGVGQNRALAFADCVRATACRTTLAVLDGEEEPAAARQRFRFQSASRSCNHLLERQRAKSRQVQQVRAQAQFLSACADGVPSFRPATAGHITSVESVRVAY